MEFAFRVLSLLVISLGVAESAKFPRNWTTCRTDGTMNDCLRGAIQGAVREMAGGMPSLGVLPLDPLHFDRITIDQGTGPVRTKLEYTDMDIFGFKNMKILSVNNDWKTMVIETQSPKIELKGNYEITGKVLVLPIQGNGKCELTMDNFIMHLKFHFSEKTAGGKIYYNIDKVDYDLDTDKLTIQFDNLFNGNKALSDNMNKFLNENWKEILNELKPNVAKTFSVALKQIGNRILSKITKDQLTPA